MTISEIHPDRAEHEIWPPDVEWQRWRVAPESCFEIAVPRGGVGNAQITNPKSCGVAMVQIDDRQFLVENTFRYSNDEVENYLVGKLSRDRSAAAARQAVDDARTFTPDDENPTDLASIPRFLRWFENSYGKHSLAALIHDQLIDTKPNKGPLGSDTLSDRFFREMMRTSGVPWLKRWIMWSAVALRTRFAAGGYRRWTIVGWLLLSVVGIGLSVAAAGSLLVEWTLPAFVPSPWWSLTIAVALILVAAPLWGRQWGASLVAAIAAFWVVPAAIVAGLAWAVYLGLERIADTVGLR
ncbi:DUF1353 domain-containing protein [Gordonia sp. NPDC003424]